MNVAADTRRLFFALWPDPGVRQQLASVARQWTRHPVAAANLHMTLLFLGGRTARELDCFREAAGNLQGETFDLQLDYLGNWAKPRIQWLGTSCIPPALPRLVDKLQQVLAPCGIEAGKQRFVPHVTLSRKEKSTRVKTGLQAVHWQVRGFVLAESVSTEGGIRYDVLERWPLGDVSRGQLCEAGTAGERG
ncbi:MAG: RNA 2',3'-cyclic phosphodiesterase [Gammaproteobacteria bacterium]|nr:MAG: RNA 2',3'-cyclic phosphodiesterase [Gammaproteobacteria bacterium]